MKKSAKILVWLVTFAVVVSLAALVGKAIVDVRKQTDENCFNYLTEATGRLAGELYRTTDMDRTILTAMAAIIADEKDGSNEKLCEIMNSYYSGGSYINYVELLRPDNTMLDSDGTVRDVGGTLDFETEAKNGGYISGIEHSTKETDERIIRNAVPVIRDGNTVFILYGVVRLSDFAEAYTTNIYDGNAYVYLVDGSTGDFMLDTWHASFGNISDFSDRQMLSEDSFSDADANMQNGLPGDLAFVSKTTGDVLYMHYEPVGINNWSVIVTVQDSYALKDSRSISSIMYRMAITTGAIVLLYMAFVVILQLKAYRHIRKLGMSDKVTGLQNRNAYDSFVSQNKKKEFASLACVYADVNGLHELNNEKGHEAGDKMLKNVADAFKAEFPNQSIFRAGGDEFVVLVENMDEEACRDKVKRVNDIVSSRGYSIAYGVAVNSGVTGCSDTILSADKQMLENKRRYYSIHDRRFR